MEYIESKIIYDCKEDFDIQPELEYMYSVDNDICLLRYPEIIDNKSIWNKYNNGEIDILGGSDNKNIIILLSKGKSVYCTGICTYNFNELWVQIFYKGLLGYVKEKDISRSKEKREKYYQEIK